MEKKVNYNKRFISFILAMLSGITAIASAVAALVINWGILVSNTGTLSSNIYNSLLNVYGYLNVTVNTSQVLQYAQNLATVESYLQQGLFVFIPLMIIAGAFMIVSAMFIKSKNKERERMGTIYTVIFSILTLIGFMVYLVLNPTAFIALFSYLGSGGSTAYLVYGLFMSYIILGVLSTIVKLTDKE